MLVERRRGRGTSLPGHQALNADDYCDARCDISAISMSSAQKLQTPFVTEKHYSTRARPHDYQLPRKTSLLDECSFVYRMLHRDILPFMTSFHTVLTVVCLFAITNCLID